MTFKIFADAVRVRFAEMSQGDLFVVDRDASTVWDHYLASFPAGSNPLFRSRTEHDCSCCRHFIRDIGHVVTIQNGALASIWDLNGLPEPYQTVADAMSQYIKGRAIREPFLSRFNRVGAEVTHERVADAVLSWDHFSTAISGKFINHAPDSKLGELRTTHQVLLRALTELTPEAVSTVVDLIREDSIYRGKEFERAVLAFQDLQGRTLHLDATARELVCWTMLDTPVATSRFRNTVIGSLLVDLSAGVELEDAVRMYEAKVAPQNYKRPTALITKAMVSSAMQTIAELDLEPALERRHAKLSDVSINSVLFVDNNVRGKLKGGIEQMLLDEVRPAVFNPDTAENILIENFISQVLPQATGLKLYLENNLLGNFMSLTAPAHADTKSLFKWNNDFAWSYDGNVADTIKDKVKRAGGKVEGVAMRVSLAWFNTDDLDLHIREPNGNHIYFGNKGDRFSGRGGSLDVDMNVTTIVRDPVENVRWERTPADGQYRVSVHNFTRRESIDVGCTVEIESSRGVEQFNYTRAVSGAHTHIADIVVKNGQVIGIIPGQGITCGSVSQEKWGLTSLDLISVNAVVVSPNYWDGNAVGNKHWFFILDGCNNPAPTRGIYNEFLHSRLDKHRKVFEVLGDKTKCPPAREQLSGVGFSSTRREKVTVVATGPNLNKAYNVVI